MMTAEDDLSWLDNVKFNPDGSYADVNQPGRSGSGSDLTSLLLGVATNSLTAYRDVSNDGAKNKLLKQQLAQQQANQQAQQQNNSKVIRLAIIGAAVFAVVVIVLAIFRRR